MDFEKYANTSSDSHNSKSFIQYHSFSTVNFDSRDCINVCMSSNLFFPKFEYENENTLIKQSTSATIMLFVGLLFILALSGLTIWLLFNLPVIYIALIIICALTTITGIVITLTYTTGQRIFNHL